MGNYKYKYYTENDIDFFIGCDINTNDVYVIPISFSSKYKNSIALSTLEPYKNNFDLL
jgi:hypothetical protein